jgi:hypothetical protein
MANISVKGTGNSGNLWWFNHRGESSVATKEYAPKYKKYLEGIGNIFTRNIPVYYLKMVFNRH